MSKHKSHKGIDGLTVLVIALIINALALITIAITIFQHMTG